MKFNYFLLIGKCVDINKNFITLLNEDNDLIKIYFDSDENISKLELDILTKVEGYISLIEPGLIILIAEKIYQIKNNNDYGDEFVV